MGTIFSPTVFENMSSNIKFESWSDFNHKNASVIRADCAFPLAILCETSQSIYVCGIAVRGVVKFPYFS
jgi:hypothetical protein